LGDYLLININEIPNDNDIEMTVGVKLLVYGAKILAFRSQSSFCLEKILNQTAHREQMDTDEVRDVLAKHKSTYNQRMNSFSHNGIDPNESASVDEIVTQEKIDMYNIPVEISTDYGCSKVE
jgi:hypothetical protein